jgi:hypothetical protein
MILTYSATKPEHPFDGGAIPYANRIKIEGTASDWSPRVCQHRSPRPRLMLLQMALFRDWLACGSETPPHHRVSEERPGAGAQRRSKTTTLADPRALVEAKSPLI